MTKILLVEDNEINRDMLSYRLKRRGYELIIAVDGVQAVSLANTENPDLILMDLSLPIMNGWDATRHIRSNPQTQNIPVIALTAHAMSGDRQEAIEAGCNDYETKPIEFPRLLKKINALLANPLTSKPQEVISSNKIEPEKIEPQSISIESSAKDKNQIPLENNLFSSVEPAKKEQENKEQNQVPLVDEIVESSRVLDRQQKTEEIATSLPAKKEQKLVQLLEPIKIVYASRQSSFWSTGSIIKLSLKNAEIRSNKRKKISLQNEIKIRFWYQSPITVKEEIYAEFLKISEDGNDSFFVQFMSEFASIGEILKTIKI